MNVLKLIYKFVLRKETREIKKNFNVIVGESKQIPSVVLDSPRVQYSDNIVVKEKCTHRKKIYFIKEEEEMSFQFSMDHKLVISNLKNEFNEVWLNGQKGDSINDKISHYKLSLDKLYKIRDFCINSGKGGRIYYTIYWDELFNSENPCFSQEEVILGKIKYFQDQQKNLDILKGVSNNIISVIVQKTSVYQKDLYRLYPNLERQDIKDIVSELADNNIITKTKRSNSFELKMVKQ